MAHVVDFEIYGLAGRSKPLRAELNRDVNIFWGLNGSGKTSLLKILHGALENDGASLARVPFESAKITIYGSDRNKNFTRTIDKSGKGSRGPRDRKRRAAYMAELEKLRESDYPITREYEEQLQLWAFGEAQLAWNTTPIEEQSPPVSFHHGYLPISRVSDSRNRRAHRGPVADVIDEAAFDAMFAHEIQELWRRYNTESLMQTGRAQERGIAEILSGILTGEYKHGESVEADEVPARDAYDMMRQFFSSRRTRPKIGTLQQFTENYSKDRLLQGVVSQIAEVQREIDDVQKPQRELENLLDELFIGKKHVNFSGRQLSIQVNDGDIPLESLSSGEKQMLRLLLEALAAKNSLILVDEPELSLHVDWQHRLIQSMQTVNPSAQILAATHSPEVMADLPDSRIFEL